MDTPKDDDGGVLQSPREILRQLRGDTSDELTRKTHEFVAKFNTMAMADRLELVLRLMLNHDLQISEVVEQLTSMGELLTEASDDDDNEDILKNIIIRPPVKPS